MCIGYYVYYVAKYKTPSQARVSARILARVDTRAIGVTVCIVLQVQFENAET